MAKVGKLLVSAWNEVCPCCLIHLREPWQMPSHRKSRERNTQEIAWLWRCWVAKDCFLKITFFPRYCPSPAAQSHIMADNVLSWCTLRAATDCAALVRNWIRSNIRAVTGHKCRLAPEKCNVVDCLDFALWNDENSCLSLGSEQSREE